MTKIPSTGELYPPAAPEGLNDFLHGVVAFRHEGGKIELKRALTLPEREKLAARSAVLAEWLRPGLQRRITEAVLDMLNGYGTVRQMSGENALDLAAQFAHTCRDLPFWATFRAADKFRRGAVKPDEIKVKSIDWNFPPSEAQFAILARSIAQPQIDEADRIERVMRASPALAGPVAADRVAGEIDKVTEHLRKRQAERETEQMERQVRVDAEAEQTRRDAIERAADTYRRAGLEPPEVKPGQIPVTLQFRLNMGWRIEDVGGKRTLVSPILNRRPDHIGDANEMIGEDR